VELKGKTGDTLRSPTVTTKLQRLAEQAARDPTRVFTTLAHLIDEDFLREAYRQTRKSMPRASMGDGHAVCRTPDENLRDPRPSAVGGIRRRRSSGLIEKKTGTTPNQNRVRDKIVQRAAVMVLKPL
jgi:hypothetical protein